MVKDIQVKVLYDFEAQPDSGELSVWTGEIIIVTRQDVGGGWWEGRNDSGDSGLFPSSYVEVIENSQSSGQPLRTPEYSADDIQILTRQDNEASQDWEDSWDEDAGDNKQKSTDKSKETPSGFLSIPSIEKKSSSTGDLSAIARGDKIGTLGMKKSFNRFSAFVKSGGETFILGETTVNVSAEDYVTIEEDDGEIMWLRTGEQYTCSVSKPKKESKLRGLKSYIAYQITPSFSNIEVSRRFKHFDWLHERLQTKYALIPIPPLPGKQFSGRYEDMFIEHRMIQLQMWISRICNHPVLGQSDVWKHFITCTDEKQWKTGKRRAERDELVGASFFHAIKAPETSLDPFQLEMQVENFSKFSLKMDNTVKSLHGTAQELCKKYSGSYKKEFHKLSSSFKELGETFEMETSPYSTDLTKAIKVTGDTYEEIGDLYGEQPRNDLEPFGDILHEYKGILASWPEIIQIQKGAIQKKKEHQKLLEEGRLSQENVTAISRRTDIISYAVLAEITQFQQEQVGEFKNMVQNFLQEQVKFYLQIAEKLQGALDLYS
ncbi:sorting nexin lst-4 [Parasteatoda tepidariorum]|uniref:sorting nexin lst-4 n=1 Tax=Parasteatoda tepidariorum TaxID=114398 RepID=UPI001C721D83|nr:sorting nexin lst-4 [Parasteatoda tepidariorum]XP_042897236.1 sorting nexin lst-4 [Parasteatoda tepidariorum]XP_042897237.1 sorting nexin lst-4 [Parasteatoda tepidariorum]XP_042897238.1 sorting nexin lst-4 [Parasteatoda tepidariorum]